MNAKSIALNEQALSVKTQVRPDPTQLYGMPDRVRITLFPLVDREVAKDGVTANIVLGE